MWNCTVKKSRTTIIDRFQCKCLHPTKIQHIDQQQITIQLTIPKVILVIDLYYPIKTLNRFEKKFLEPTQPLLVHRQISPQPPSPDQHVYEHITPYATIIPTKASSTSNHSPAPPPNAPTNVNLNYVQVQFPSTSNGQFEETLNFRLQTVGDSETESDITTSPNTKRIPFGSDINPSVGDSSDRESDVNAIRRMESSVSSLSGVHESSTSPPVRNRNVADRQRRHMSPETDF